MKYIIVKIINIFTLSKVIKKIFIIKNHKKIIYNKDGESFICLWDIAGIV